VILPLRRELEFLFSYIITRFSNLCVDFWVVTLYNCVGGY